MVRGSGGVGLAFAAWFLALPSLACADVMEVGGSGYSWVVGSPRAGNVAPAPHQPTDLDSPIGLDNTVPEPWRARIAELAGRYDLSPSLLEALVWQESRWHTASVSPAGARGLAQLMPGTARQLGVNADDPNANLEGGARYLRYQLDRFGGDLEKALAAYNAGPERVRKADGVPAIPETRHYVAAILARLSETVRR